MTRLHDSSPSQCVKPDSEGSLREVRLFGVLELNAFAQFRLLAPLGRLFLELELSVTTGEVRNVPYESSLIPASIGQHYSQHDRSNFDAT